MPLTVPHFYQWFPVHLFSIFKWLNIRLLCGTVSRFLANSYHMSTEDLALKAVFWILMSPNKGESTVHGCHCPSDMVVRMGTAELVVCASCWIWSFWRWFWSVLFSQRLGSLRKHVDDATEDVKKATGFTSKATTVHAHPASWYISWPSLHDYNGRKTT